MLWRPFPESEAFEITELIAYLRDAFNKNFITKKTKIQKHVNDSCTSIFVIVSFGEWEKNYRF